MKNLTLRNNIEGIINEFDNYWQLRDFTIEICKAIEGIELKGMK